MAKMVPKIVKRAGTLNRHLRVQEIMQEKWEIVFEKNTDLRIHGLFLLFHILVLE